MELSHSLRLRQQTKLVMTPQLQQVIKLLTLPTVELVEHVRQELETNPTLEEGQDHDATTPAEAPADRAADDKPAGEDPAEEGMDAWLKLQAEAGPREERDRSREEEMEDRPESRLVPVATLQDHLVEQLHETSAGGEERRLAEFLIGNLDANGYLASPLAELAPIAGAEPADLERALLRVQALEPAGVGARDLKECLLLQLGTGPKDALAVRIVSDHLPDLDRHADQIAARLADTMGASPADIAEAVKRIRTLDPKPGGRFTPVAPTVMPDARIDQVGEDYLVSLNDGGVPPLRLSKTYRELLARRGELGEEERHFLQERFRSAQMLLKGIEQRRVTLQRVMEHIVTTQRGFLERGPASLKPLTLREVADAVGVHESTVSRVVSNKYITTPRGTVALKDFFSNRLPAASADGMSGAAVRERLRDLIEGESAGRPLSDDALAEALQKDGISIARRTVTKYREGLNIPPASRRKSSSKPVS